MDNNQRTRILQTAFDLFNARGYKSVTIKDIADKLGMSKKTIYQYFSSKEDIASAVMEEAMKKIDDIAGSMELTEDDPFGILKDILLHAKDEYMWFKPLFLQDIEKFLPDLALKYKEFRNNKKQNIRLLFKKAQDMNLMRDIPIPLVTELLSVCMKAIIRSESFVPQRLSNLDALDLFMDIFRKGVAPYGVDRDEFKS